VLRTSNSLATAAHFISWNYTNPPNVLLNLCTLLFFTVNVAEIKENKKVATLTYIFLFPSKKLLDNFTKLRNIVQ